MSYNKDGGTGVVDLEIRDVGKARNLTKQIVMARIAKSFKNLLGEGQGWWGRGGVYRFVEFGPGEGGSAGAKREGLLVSGHMA